MRAAAPTPGAWHHYAYTFDGTTHRLYIEGVLRAGSSVAPLAGPPAQLQFGRWPGGGGYLHGAIDDLRIYNRTLSAAEVQTLASQP